MGLPRTARLTVGVLAVFMTLVVAGMGVTTPEASWDADQSPATAPVAVETAPEPPRTYVVEQGDTLWSVADSFGVSLEELIVANDLADPHTLDLGQELLLPRGARTLPRPVDPDAAARE